MLVEYFPKIEKKKAKIQNIYNIFIKKNQTKARFSHDMAYGDFKDLPERTSADK